MFRIIRGAGQLLLSGKDTGHEVRYKSDNSIVTSLDHQCAAFLDQEIQAHFPEDGILNEETHPTDDDAPWFEAERCWVLDPLDSTSSFVRNGQHYGVILGLTLRGRPQVGMTYKPELGELYFAVRGEGAHRAFVASGPEPLQVLPVRVSPDARLSLILSHGRQTPGLKELLHKLGDPPSHRMNGSLKINEVSRGAYTAFVSPTQNPMSLWDLAATQLVLEEAGGRVTDLRGRPLDFRNPNPILTEGIIASNSVTHAVLLEKLARG